MNHTHYILVFEDLDLKIWAESRLTYVSEHQVTTVIEWFLQTGSVSNLQNCRICYFLDISIYEHFIHVKSIIIIIFKISSTVENAIWLLIILQLLFIKKQSQKSICLWWNSCIILTPKDTLNSSWRSGPEPQVISLAKTDIFCELSGAFESDPLIPDRFVEGQHLFLGIFGIKIKAG